MISLLKRDSPLLTFLVHLLAPLVIMLKTSSTLCAFLTLLTGPPVLDPSHLLHSEAGVDHLSVHSLRLNLEHVPLQIRSTCLCCQTLFTML